MSQSPLFAKPATAVERGVTLVLGGARSGKSRFAEKLATDAGEKVIYIASAEAKDEEMRQRIALHQQRRDTAWRTIEVPLGLAAAVRAHSRRDSVLLIDCLTIWISNLMAANRDVFLDIEALVDALLAVEGRVICVANEVGLGIVPDNALARAFRDHAGLCNRMVAEAANEVYFLAAGLPVKLKPRD